MTTIDIAQEVSTDLAAKANRHLWGHFARHGKGITPPIITRGEGVTIWDDKGKSYIDGLSGLFVVQVGHGRKELAEAAAKQAETLAFFPLWSYATPPAIELSERLANYAPGDLNRVFFTTGGGEAVESAWGRQAVLQADRQAVEAQGDQPVIAYHGTPWGARRHRPSSVQGAVRPMTPGGFRVPNTSFYRAPAPCAPTSRRSGRTARTASPRPSSSRAPTPSPRCSWSRCRTRVGASHRRPGTSSGFARSATSTTCSWCPTR